MDCDHKLLGSISQKGSDEWGTPRQLFMSLDNEFDFTLDPCGNPNRMLKGHMQMYTKKENGLNQSWEDQRVFCNPPYTYIKRWVQKCYSERNKAELIVMLIPVRTDTKYFHDFIYTYAELRFIRGRLYFIDHSGKKMKNNAPFPSMLCIYRRNEK